MQFRKAILVIHGFSGSTYDQEYLRNYLEFYHKFDCFSFTLPAHHQMILNHVKYQDWIDAVEKQMEFILKNGYRTVYVIGHSMGGVLASYLASKYKQIKKLVLVAPAFDSFSKEQYLSDLRNLKNIKNEEDVAYRYLFSKIIRVPAKSLLEFRKLVEELRPSLAQVSCDTLVLHGNQDEVVPYHTVSYVEEQLRFHCKRLHITTVIEGRHNMLRGKKKEKLAEYINIYLIGGRKWKQMKKQEL